VCNYDYYLIQKNVTDKDACIYFGVSSPTYMEVKLSVDLKNEKRDEIKNLGESLCALIPE
jgi:hypothetical protein